jgi:cytidylate kinase
MNRKSGIMIIGPSGSGKTTLGKKLADALGYPFFDVDEFIWRFDTPEPYTVMYSREEKISRLQDAIAPYEHFVMAGSMSSFHTHFDVYFGMMVFLYAAPDIRVERVKERAVQRFGDRVAEGGDMYESNQQFLKDNRRYEEDGSPNLREQKEWMNSLSCIKLELDGAKDIDENIRIITDIWNKRD